MTPRSGILLSLILLSLTAAQALAVEPGLAGVRIGESAMQLLTDPAFGPPAYLGPVGLSISRESAPPFGSPALSRPVAFQGATAAPSGALTPFGGSLGGLRGPSLFGRRDRSGATAPVGAIAPLPSVAAAAGPAAPGTPASVMLWLYKRTPNLLVVELSAEGKVTGVIVDGMSPALAETARGIRMGASYEQILAAYGYPNQTANEGQNLILRYLYDGLTFRLSNMRLVAMRLSQNPLAPIPGGGAGAASLGGPGPAGPAPVAPAAAAAPVAPGAAAPGATTSAEDDYDRTDNK